MPIDYKKYPPSWKTEIRPAILERAKHCCEQCGLKNHAVGYRNSEGMFIECHAWLYNESKVTPDGHKVIKIVLTIAHLDHDITNNDPANLRALCQKCHLSLDKDQHRQSSRKTINKKKGLQELF